MSGGNTKETTVEKLHNIIDLLPYSNRKTLGVLMHHLQRYVSYSFQPFPTYNKSAADDFKHILSKDGKSRL